MATNIAAPAITNNRYQILEQAGSGGMGMVFRALDRLTGQTIALKQVTAAPENLHFSSIGSSRDFRLALANEFKILASLRHPNIVSVLDYGFDDQNHPFFTMEFIENASTIIDAGVGKTLGTKLNLLVQLLQALAYLHRRGILHRDLKPANVLVVNNQVKVLDFGLSSRGGGEEGETVGTLAYMAPEILMGDVATRASDLYAFGVIAYEMLAEQHPFSSNDVSKLVNEILQKVPDLSLLELDARIAVVIERLLAKLPENRFNDASEILQAYSEATNQQFTIETLASRESFLQAAEFVGREAEFVRLSDAFNQAKAGEGSLWLIGGESGVGKSRFLDELRTLALVQGAAVLRGQAISDGGTPYQVWRDVLRPLCLQTPPDDHDASVLKLIMPDIAVLLGREVRDAPEISPQASQIRLLSAIETLFQQQTRPVVVVLEDLHWEGSETLVILKRLARSIHQVRLLLVGSFRDDERPELPKELPEATLVKLERFNQENVAALAESMLGEAGRQPQLVELLHRETEGNVFFMVEVVRALAEEAGQLDRIGSVPLREKVFTGGIQRVIQRRLEHLPEADQPLLRLAAVFGRQIDLAVLRAIAPETDLPQWLLVCETASVLDVHEDTWRFAHDKLREKLLADIAGETGERQRIHRRVAQAIEQVYPNDASQAARLAHHWAEAGDVEKEAHYTAIAGGQALHSGAYKEAGRLLTRTLALYERLNISNLQRARATYLLSESNLGIGNLIESRACLEQALQLLGYTLPTDKRATVRVLLRQLGRQVLHRTHIIRPHSEGEEREKLTEAARIYLQLSEVLYRAAEREKMLAAVISSVNTAERSDAFASLSGAYAAFALALGILGAHKFAVSYVQRALEAADKSNNPFPKAIVLFRIGMYKITVCAWDEVDSNMTRAINQFSDLSERRNQEECSGILAEVYGIQGKFQQSMDLYRWLYTSAVENSQSTHSSGWGLVGQARGLMTLGQTDAAIEMLESALQLSANYVGAATLRIMNYAVLALAYWHKGDREKGRQLTDETSRLLAHETLSTTVMFHGFANVTGIYLELLEAADPASTDYKTLEALVERSLKALKKYAKSYGFARPRLHLCTGTLAWLRGDQANALKSWQTGLETAERVKLPFDQGLILYEMARWQRSRDHAQRALDLFNGLGAGYHVQQVQALLKHMP